MKKFTITKFMCISLAVLQITAVNAQTETTRNSAAFKVVTSNKELSAQNQVPATMNFSGSELNANNKTAMTACTDKVNYVGNTQIGTFKVGGSNGFNGLYQVFPTYKGTVIGIEFDAAKYPGSNPTVSVQILNSNSAGYPGNTIAGPAAVITITNTNPTTYTVMFPSPVPVNGNFGFGVAFYNYTNSADSVRLYRGPSITAPLVEYSFLTVPNTSTYTSVYGYFGFDIDFLIRPIISTSVNPSWVSAKTSTGCGVPATYTFSNNGGAGPVYENDIIINPAGITKVLNFGDGSPVTNFTLASPPLTHSYTTIGNYVANYTQTYVGWTNNCVETLSTTIVVDNPLPSFTYNTGGLTVNFNNTSLSMSSYTWNFGDLSTSTQINPTHTYSSPGTYVVELEGMAACGKVKFSLSIVVSGATGISENSAKNNLISLFPNPVSNVLKVTINSKTELNSKLEIYNSVGASVKTVYVSDFNSGSATIDVSDLSKGVYFLKFKSKEGDSIKSFIKE